MIQQIEELSMNAWPALQTCFYDGWVMRFADGYTKRSNSILPIYESTICAEEKISFCEQMYAAWGLPTVFKLTEKSNPQGLDDILERKSYQKLDETAVRLLDLNHYTTCKPKDVILDEKFTENWIDSFFQCSGLTDEKQQTAAKQILENIRSEVVCVAKTVEDKIVGCGFGVMERGFVGIFDIVVSKHYRRNGFGLDIMNGILTKAKEKGVQNSYLQVVVGNEPAECLYTKLGYKEIYHYWYRKK
ncbi:MAG: GNAT family N-acetyltransferase [Thermoclostridium sp.]|nr:GNAT family N-acetyltransferase [Thermoclostridium sp.]